MLALHLPADIEKRLEDLVRKTGRSRDYYIREAVVEHLADLEDLYLAEERLRQLQDGKSDTVSLSDLMKAYGLDN